MGVLEVWPSVAFERFHAIPVERVIVDPDTANYREKWGIADQMFNTNRLAAMS